MRDVFSFITNLLTMKIKMDVGWLHTGLYRIHIDQTSEHEKQVETCTDRNILYIDCHVKGANYMLSLFNETMNETMKNFIRVETVAKFFI